jgi:hypothetical protein
VRTGIKRFLPAFMLGMFQGMAGAKAIGEPTQAPQKRTGKAKGGGKRRGFIHGLPHRSARGTKLGAAIMLYFEKGKPKYARPDIDGMRQLMEKNWHREFMGKLK